nr:MAG TPA: hypothetical protein [Caudoviricetes sp.]
MRKSGESRKVDEVNKKLGAHDFQLFLFLFFYIVLFQTNIIITLKSSKFNVKINKIKVFICAV